jgi:hypothetical protein
VEVAQQPALDLRVLYEWPGCASTSARCRMRCLASDHDRFDHVVTNREDGPGVRAVDRQSRRLAPKRLHHLPTVTALQPSSVAISAWVASLPRKPARSWSATPASATTNVGAPSVRVWRVLRPLKVMSIVGVLDGP